MDLSDLNLAETYQYQGQQRFPVRVLVFCGADDQDVSTANATAWHQLSTHHTALQMVDGNHFLALRRRP